MDVKPNLCRSNQFYSSFNRFINNECPLAASNIPTFLLVFFGEIERFPKGRGHHGHLLGSCKSHKVIVGTLKLKIKCYLAAQQNNEAFQ